MKLLPRFFRTARKSTTLAVCLFIPVLSSLTTLTGCKRSESDSGSLRTNRKEEKYFRTQFQDESQFIVETIVSDIAEQVFYAKHHHLPDPKHFCVKAQERPDSPFGAPVYDVHVGLDKGMPDLLIELKVERPIWSPDLYEELTERLAKAVSLTVTKRHEAPDTSLPARLTDATAITIESENQKLSDALERDFGSPTLHEKAAVLLGAFALREHSHQFYDIRLPLCRMSAHLAVAQFLKNNDPPGINGDLAQVMLFTLMNDQAAAVEKLKVITTAGDDGLSRWVRVLRTRITGDFRPLASLNSPSMLETITWFQAASRYGNADLAWKKVDKLKTKYADFCRIAEDVGYSVETGNELIQLALPLELQEAANVYETAHGQKLGSTELANVLNQTPQRCFLKTQDGKVTPKVIGWGQWAMFLQQHLCLALIQDFNIYQVKLGLPEDAKNFNAHADSTFGGLRLYPFVRRYNCTDADSYRTSVDAGFKVTTETPHLVPADCWNELCYKVSFAEHYQPVANPHINEWHKHNPPPGTAYNPHPRLNHPSLVERPDAASCIAKLHELAPYDLEISEYIQEFIYKNQPTHEQAMSLYGAIMDYAPGAAAVIAQTVEDQPEQYEALMTNGAAMDPSLYFLIGDFFLKRNDADRAAGYFEKGAKFDPDSLRAASYAGWRIKYYLQKGQKGTARQVADAAGEVYSQEGLEAKAQFHEAVGEYSQAFECYTNIEERYSDSVPVMRFCSRYKVKTGSVRYDRELQARLLPLFPGGVERVRLNDFQGQPKDGVLISQNSDLLAKAGLKQGDVIVAVDGLRTRNSKQYEYGRELKGDPEMDLIVWQDVAYKEIKASPPNHRFGVSLADYSQK